MASGEVVEGEVVMTLAVGTTSEIGLEVASTTVAGTATVTAVALMTVVVGDEEETGTAGMQVAAADGEVEEEEEEEVALATAMTVKDAPGETAGDVTSQIFQNLLQVGGHQGPVSLWRQSFQVWGFPC